jgi:hypothetical protein
VPINADLKESFVGGKQLYLLQGDGVCRLKYSSDPLLVKDSFKENGELLVDVDPLLEYTV